jgi:hypothetical protein
VAAPLALAAAVRLAGATPVPSATPWPDTTGHTAALPARRLAAGRLGLAAAVAAFLLLCWLAFAIASGSVH